MKKYDNELSRITAFLSGEMTAEEKQSFNEWLNASDINRETFREAKLIWESSGIRYSLQEKNEDMAWSEFIEKRDQTKSIQFPLLLKVAAGVALLVTLTYIVFRPTEKGLIFQAMDQVKMIYLPDSSRVWLNTGSQLSWSQDKSRNERSVLLDGEAYFEVAKDSLKPFIVSAGEAVVTVLGTSFNVNMDAERLTVAVAEGVVAVVSGSDERVELRKEDEAVVTSGEIRTGKSEIKNIGVWRQLNNPQAAMERENALRFLANTAHWKKNRINMSVVQGTLTNTATLTTYSNIVLKVTYKKQRGDTGLIRITLDEEVPPGATVNYQKRLLDILSATEMLSAEIESAEAE